MSRKLMFIATVGLASIASLAVAQNQPDQNGGNNGGGGGGRQNGGGGGPGGGGGRGNWDPAQMQKMMMDRMKEELKSPDDEWNVISPKLEAVVKAQNDARVGGFGGRGGPGGGGGRGPGGGGPGGGGGGPGGDQNQSELAKASRELRTALDSENSSADTIAGKLKAFRDARAKAEDALKTAREGLKGVLSERQEAVLVQRGILE